MSLGLVLGGGGVVGVAWEIGVLAGIAEELGWDPSRSTTLVGTSAGALIGARLLAGASLDDLVASERQPADGQPVSGSGPVTGADVASARSPGDPAKVMEIFRLWGGAQAMDAATARQVATLASEVPTVTEEGWISVFSPLLGPEWPEADLRITGVSAATGSRQVWTSDSGVPLVRAVAASCAVPGLFPPVSLADQRFVDGGLWSGSNLDVLAAAPVDSGLFVGPMGSAPGGVGQLSARTLERETADLASGGMNVTTVTPGERFAAAGLMLMDASRRAEAVEIGLQEGAESAPSLKPLLT